MKEINYKFVDGTTKTIEVSDDFYENYIVLEKETKSLERKETRRHTSLDFLKEQGIEFVDKTQDVEELLEKNDIQTRVKEAIKDLTTKQQDLVHRVFFYGEKPSDIAKELGINKSVISRQLQAIYSHLKKLLKN